VDSPGDNILAEFASVVDVVNCAVEVQRELAEWNTELPDNRTMQFRIGVNLGDIVEDGDSLTLLASFLGLRAAAISATANT
jgi:adenylate cyclase